MPPIYGVLKQTADTAEEDERLGILEYASQHFCGPVLYDEEQALYKLLGVSGINVCKLLCNPCRTASIFREANRRGSSLRISGNMAGDWYTQGGILVVATDGSIVFKHLEEFGSALPLVEIEQAILSIIQR
uniref:Peroxiredoxin-like 2 activated in M-CSF stimulated monocytes n=1 Tax=Coccolithus braarudii TaxID=221442 RepID=A0A7S0L4Z0_9EUKA|mmetsp:Transcript_1547/g.3345  ORF Transcript_1547/g.3345 Transcript_1547/m.3345 type:complete len:131 (+) Transcript_1547:356-748(+)